MARNDRDQSHPKRHDDEAAGDQQHRFAKTRGAGEERDLCGFKSTKGQTEKNRNEVGLFGEHDEWACRGGVGDGDSTGGFRDELAGVALGFDDLGGAAATGHEQAPPVILKLAGIHAGMGLQKGILRGPHFRDDDHYASVAEHDLFAEKDGFDTVGIKRLAGEPGIADEYRFGVE